jgi:hypothetical protein
VGVVDGGAGWEWAPLLAALAVLVLHAVRIGAPLLVLATIVLVTGAGFVFVLGAAAGNTPPSNTCGTSHAVAQVVPGGSGRCFD